MPIEHADYVSYYKLIGDALAGRIRVAQEVLKLTSNSAVIGAFAEAAVNALIREIAAPARVSSGTIVSPQLIGNATPQLDTIVWTPMPLPAVFELGDVAIVPYESVLAVLEVKRSNYSDTADRIEHRSSEAHRYMKAADGQFLGVICVRTNPPSEKLLSLVRSKKCVWLIEAGSDGELKANTAGFIQLISTLARARQKMFGTGAQQGVHPFAQQALENEVKDLVERKLQ